MIIDKALSYITVASVTLLKSVSQGAREVVVAQSNAHIRIRENKSTEVN